jgi:glycosyltransferase involved in cell wall biosynthesis
MEHKQYKILFLITQLEFAGAQKAMLALAGGLKRRGHIVSVVTMYDKAGCIPEFSRKYDLEIIDLQMKKKRKRNYFFRIMDFLGGIWVLYQLLRREKYNIVQTFSHYSNILGPLVAWAAGVKVRVSSQRMSLRGAPRWLLILDKLVANSFLVDKMVAVSNGTLQFCLDEGIKKEKLVTIYNGIDIESYAPNSTPGELLERLRYELNLNEKVVIIITVARLHTQKGHNYLLKAIPKVVEKYSHARFLLVGDGPELQALKETTSNLNINEYVRFLGVRNDIPTLLSISSLFVLPSLWEGMPNSILEAMSSGLPVIATNVDGCPELVVHGKTGLLVSPADSDAIWVAICQLLGDKELLWKMGIAGRTRAINQFSEENFIQSFNELYQGTLEDIR